MTKDPKMGLALKRTPKWERPKKGPQNESGPKKDPKMRAALKRTPKWD